MSGWHGELGPALERMARSERPIPEDKNYDADADGWNAKFAAAKRDTPVSHGNQIHAWRASRGIEPFRIRI